MVGVLILIDKHVPEPPVVVLGDIGEQLQDRHRRGDQVVEVEGIGPSQAALIVGVGLGEGLLLVVARAPRERFVVDQLVLQVGHLRAEGARRIALEIEVEVAAHQGHESLGVSGVIDRERRRHPQPRRFLAQDAYAGGVEGRHPHRPGSRPDELDHALTHLTSSLVGERDGQDLGRAGITGGEQVRDPAGQHPGLTRASAGHDEQGRATMLDSSALLGIEVVDECVDRGTRARGLHRLRARQTGVIKEGGHRPTSLGRDSDTPCRGSLGADAVRSGDVAQNRDTHLGTE